MGKPANAETYRKATRDLALQAQPRVVVEVGVYEGALSRMLAGVPSIERQVIVDNWDGSYSNFGQAHMDKVAAGVMAWAKQNNVEVLRMRSEEAALLFEDDSVDFFHTDGDHSLSGISTDIVCWLPKVRTGGYLSGDNYEIPAVAQMVNDLLPWRSLSANGRLWYAEKR